MSPVVGVAGKRWFADGVADKAVCSGWASRLWHRPNSKTIRGPDIFGRLVPVAVTIAVPWGTGAKHAGWAGVAGSLSLAPMFEAFGFPI